MSAREWQPGTIAMVTCLNRREEWRAMHDGKTWREIRGLPVGVFCVDSPTAVRPLVVIDPEDREQAERLRDVYMRARAGATSVTDALQTALRYFANPTPPRPEEPTGLGAVVATESDGDFIRVSLELSNPWLNVQSGNQYHYDSIAAVRVLSEGVQL